MKLELLQKVIEPGVGIPFWSAQYPFVTKLLRDGKTVYESVAKEHFRDDYSLRDYLQFLEKVTGLKIQPHPDTEWTYPDSGPGSMRPPVRVTVGMRR